MFIRCTWMTAHLFIVSSLSMALLENSVVLSSLNQSCLVEGHHLRYPVMPMMNETFSVACIESCDTLLHNPRIDDYLWRETEIGCRLLLLLQEMHKFNITYINNTHTMLDYNEEKWLLYDNFDIYVKPRALWGPTVLNGTPIMPILIWKFGFILRHPYPDSNHFYGLPFSPTVWESLLAMILLVSVLFYILNLAEQRLLGQQREYCFWHELLTAIGVYCQHYHLVSPLELTSRRIAYFSFFMFSNIIYLYYTSTLLSDLVYDRDNEMNLDDLASSTHEHVVLDSVASITKVLVEQLRNRRQDMSPLHFNFIQKKLTNIRVVNISTGLELVKNGNAALLSDYMSLYTPMKKAYNRNEVCEIIKVHLFSNVLKYFFTSKNFKYAEAFKISTLRAKETGILQRLLKLQATPPLINKQCISSNFQAHMGYVSKPLWALAFSFILSVFMLLGERFYYERNKVWPYVE